MTTPLNDKSQSTPPLISRPGFAFKAVHSVLSIPTLGSIRKYGQRMCRAVLVRPHLESLDRPDTSDAAERICPALAVGPDDVHVKAVHEVLPSEVALEPEGRLDSGELVFHLGRLVENDHAVFIRVSHPVRLTKRDVLLQLKRVGELPVTRMQSMRYCVRRGR